MVMIDENEIDRLIADIGLDDFKMLLNAFLKEYISKLESLSRNLNATNHELLELDSHTLKSLARTFGAVELGDACAKLEQAAKHQEQASYHDFFEAIQTSGTTAVKALEEKYS